MSKLNPIVLDSDNSDSENYVTPKSSVDNVDGITSDESRNSDEDFIKKPKSKKMKLSSSVSSLSLSNTREKTTLVTSNSSCSSLSAASTPMPSLSSSLFGLDGSNNSSTNTTLAVDQINDQWIHWQTVYFALEKKVKMHQYLTLDEWDEYIFMGYETDPPKNKIYI